MNLPPKHVTVFLAGLLVFTAYCPVHADSEAPPRDFKVVTGNGKYVFVMLADQDLGGFDPEIRSVYTESGLYANDGSPGALWTVGWYSFKVFPSSDGMHLVRMGPWATSLSDLALAFYANGEELKRYSIESLVRDKSKLDYTVSHFFWKSEYNFDDSNLLFTLRTKDDRRYTFSVTTGEILHDLSRPPR